jgi:hypothetical protein
MLVDNLNMQLLSIIDLVWLSVELRWRAIDKCMSSNAVAACAFLSWQQQEQR